MNHGDLLIVVDEHVPPVGMSDERPIQPLQAGCVKGK